MMIIVQLLTLLLLLSVLKVKFSVRSMVDVPCFRLLILCSRMLRLRSRVELVSLFVGLFRLSSSCDVSHIAARHKYSP